MTTTDTLGVRATVRQTIELAEAGCEIVRITAPSVRAAEALAPIVRAVRESGFDLPLVADIHFLPQAALEAVKYITKSGSPATMPTERNFRFGNTATPNTKRNWKGCTNPFLLLFCVVKNSAVPCGLERIMAPSPTGL